MDSKLLLSFSFCCAAYIMYAQSPALRIGEQFSLESKLLGEKRSVWVFEPEEAKQQPCPVLYLLDGEWNFHYTTGIVRQMISSGDIPPILVVGVVNANRNRDLTPAGPDGIANARFGGAETFLRFLTEEVHPFIASRYRLHPFKLIAGHSFGGLFTIYSMMKNPAFFQGFIALSPSLGRNNEQQVQVAQVHFRESELPKQRLFLAVGNEGGYTQLSSEKFKATLEQLKANNLSWRYQHWPKENHVSITIPGLRAGLQYLFEGYNLDHFPALDDFFLVEKHMQHLAERLGYPIPVPEEQFQQFVSQLIAERDLDYAFYLLDKYKEAFPNSTALLRYYGDAYLLKGKVKEAKGYYEKLLEAEPDQSDIQQLLNSLK
ncbi:MAG: tetratricopeptide repeat protein [Saprospiraceae bacterium]|nr:tetratricopeptide repeat protein [Saprospiraceae bacterium]